MKLKGMISAPPPPRSVPHFGLGRKGDPSSEGLALASQLAGRLECQLVRQVAKGGTELRRVDGLSVCLHRSGRAAAVMGVKRGETKARQNLIGPQPIVERTLNGTLIWPA